MMQIQKNLKSLGLNQIIIQIAKYMLKNLESGLFYKEYIIIWFKDREIQIRNNGQILLETLYDLIKANLVVKE